MLVALNNLSILLKVRKAKSYLSLKIKELQSLVLMVHPCTIRSSEIIRGSFYIRDDDNI